ncbi:MAG: helicase C-terminal domain-containing protein [Atopococcus tabaci]|uniref:3'-5' exonuclease DinG n=1 Tax=Atopococcus tabaci TaxID=269774 RepID=A0AA43RKK1_9LACT|nr:helicase C-terminal domain-containing protein [Atopococcus tabaci]
MKQSVRFAVVDLETTGSSYKQGDRIIQFGCSFIQNNKVTETIEFKINPERRIAPEIEQLTGVTNEMVEKSPYFSEVAPLIAQLLDSCVFVAHNVDFDFNFLNFELEQAGYEKLQVSAIDTVILSRILLPQESAYSLQALNESMDLGLTKAHDAGEDAQATAYLLLKLINKAETLPQLTLSTLYQLAQNYPFQTDNFFDFILTKQNRAENKNHFYFEGIALKESKIIESSNYRVDKQYPQELSDKKALFENYYEVRPHQLEMMDVIHDYLISSKEEHLAMEAPSGSGKTLAYLLPALYEASEQHPVILSTYSIPLQHQLVEEDIQTLKKILPFDFSIAILKGQSHYVDLEVVVHLLRQGERDQTESVNLSKLLVWLTETNTGDLDEIINENHTHPFWKKVRSTKHHSMISSTIWAEHDFFLRSRQAASKARVIVTNHAFLAHDILSEDSILPKEGYFICDEAHHLFDYFQQVSTSEFSFYAFQNFLDQNFIEKGSFFIREQLEPANMRTKVYYQQLVSNSEYLIEESEKIQHFFTKSFNFNIEDISQGRSFQKEIQLEQLTLRTKRYLQGFSHLFLETFELFQLLLEEVLLIYPELNDESQLFIDDLYETYQRFTDYYHSYQDLNQLILNQKGSKHWISTSNHRLNDQFSIVTYQHDLFEKRIRELFKLDKLIYCSAALEGLEKYYQLYHQESTLRKIIAPSPFNYRKQTKILIPEDLLPVNAVPNKDYEEMLAHYIKMIVESTSQSILILFNSISTLENVYSLIKSDPLFDRRALFAQGIHGTRHRLIRRFRKIDQSVLLGSHSFWEGIDLPGQSLSILVVTRLPFESPQDIWHQIRSQYFTSQKDNSFYTVSLPRAKEKLKQGFGRLIRHPDDKGIMILLDDRFVYSKYSDEIQKAVPSETPIEFIADEDFSKINDFFND